MATLPSPDPDRYGDVHVLRRQMAAEWEKAFAAGEADPAAYRDRAKELEAKAAALLEEQTGTGSALIAIAEAQRLRAFETAAHERQAAQLKRAAERERNTAAHWRGIAAVLMVMLALATWLNWRH